jgi:hypothetical protein
MKWEGALEGSHAMDMGSLLACCLVTTAEMMVGPRAQLEPPAPQPGLLARKGCLFFSFAIFV